MARLAFGAKRFVTASQNQQLLVSCCITALVAGSVLLVVATAIEPHAGWVILVSMLTLLALAVALAVDFAIDGSKGAAGVQISLRQLFVIVTCVAVYLSLLREPWTFHLRFAASRSALGRLAAQVASGAEVEPQWAGLFFIKKAARKERDDGTYTILWTEPGGGSPTGFVHPAPRHAPSLNDWADALQNDPEWQYFIQD